jgi:hypothetical protein
MENDKVEVFFGDEPKDPTERKFLHRLRGDLEKRGIAALILVNIELGRSGLQLDFVVATRHRTVQCELKGYVHPVIGGVDGEWEQLLPDGARRKVGNGGRQAKAATYVLSDTLRSFAEKSSVPSPSRGGFSRDIDTVLCMYPVIPEGSNIEVPRFVTLREYADLLASLTERGPRVSWTREQWYEFIRHRRLFRLEERPGLERQARAEGYLAADYCRQFVTAHGLGLPTQVPTAVRVEETDIESVELATTLRNGEAAVLRGPSGVGKTLMSKHAAVELARSGALPIWLEAAAYDADFDALLGRSVAPFTTFPARELIRIASSAGRGVALFVDGLNECPPDLRSDLLRQVGALRLAHQAGVVISCRAPLNVPESLDGRRVELLLPDRAEKELILRSYEAGELAVHSDAFATPFELKIAAECAGEVDARSTRVSVFDAYVDRVCGGERVRAVLRSIAWQMHSDLRGVMRVRDVVHWLEREGAASAETVDAALECRLLRVDAGLVSFVHESFVRFLASEAIVIDSLDATVLCAALAQPSNEELRGDVLALESEERLGAAISTLEDGGVLVAAIVGELGERCRIAVEEQVGRLLERARTITDEAQPETSGWKLAREWSKAEVALLRAVGHSINRGRLLPGTVELIERTDARCLEALERGTLADRHAVRGPVEAAYFPWLTEEQWLPAAVILQAARNEFAGRRKGYKSSGVPAELLARAGAHSWGLLLLTAAVFAFNDPGDHEIVPELLRRGWEKGAECVRLEVLSLVEDMGTRIEGSLRARVVELIDRLGINSAEVADAYGLLGERPLEDVEQEIAASLALAEDDERAGSTAQQIVSARFEPITGPYGEAIEALDDADRTELYRRAIFASKADSLGIDVAVAELAKCGDLSDPRVQEAFRAVLRAPGSDSWHFADWGMASCLEAIDASARFAAEPVLPLEELPGFEGWRAVFGLLFWQERERIEGVDHSARLDELLGRLREPVVRAGAPVVLYLIHACDMWRESEELSAHERLLRRFPEEIRELLHWSLTHEQELTSCILHREGAAASRYAVDMLGLIGDLASVGLLRSLANDVRLGAAARLAVRAIEQRSGGSI